MVSENTESSRKVFSGDWLQFWDELKVKSNATFLLGFSIIILAGLAVGYIGSLKVRYANQFYHVSLSLNFLEDILPGTKIRYQGALIVGEVVSIDPGGNHDIKIRLKKGFTIPKRGSRISLQSWGYFGAKFINNRIINSYRKSEMYAPGDTIPVVDTTNSTIIMNDFYNVIKKPGENELSPLEAKLQEVTQMAKRLNRSKYAKPAFMRRLLRQKTRQAKKYFVLMNSAGMTSYQAIFNLNSMAENAVGQLGKVLPRWRQRIISIRKSLGYPREETVSASFWHEEAAYDEVLEYAKYINERMAEFKENPYLILYGE